MSHFILESLLSKLTRLKAQYTYLNVDSVKQHAEP